MSVDAVPLSAYQQLTPPTLSQGTPPNQQQQQPHPRPTRPPPTMAQVQHYIAAKLAELRKRQEATGAAPELRHREELDLQLAIVKKLQSSCLPVAQRPGLQQHLALMQVRLQAQLRAEQVQRQQQVQALAQQSQNLQQNLQQSLQQNLQLQLQQQQNLQQSLQQNLQQLQLQQQQNLQLQKQQQHQQLQLQLQLQNQNQNQQRQQQQQQQQPPPQQPLPPPPPTKVQEIRALDLAIKVALSGGGGNSSNSSSNSGGSNSNAIAALLRSLHSVTPPVWWLIFEKYPQERCAPLTAFPHFPLASVWPDYLAGGVIFEIRLLPSELPANTQTSAAAQGPNGIVHNYFTTGSGSSGSSAVATTNSSSTTASTTTTSNTSSTLSHNGIAGGRSSPLNTKAAGVNRKRNNNSTSENNSGNSGGGGGNSGNSNNAVDNHKDCYWFVRIVGNSGCYLRLRYLGLNSSSSSSSNNASSNSNASAHDFWVNFRLRNLFPVGYAKAHGHRMKPPKEVDAAHNGSGARIMAAVRAALSSGGARQAPTDLHGLFTEALPGAPWLKAGLRVEAADKTKAACYRPATVDQLVGDRIHVRYDGEAAAGETEAAETAGLWTHLQGGQLRPVGWSQLVGAELLACEQYAEKSRERAMNVLVGGHLKRGERRVEEWGALTREEKFSEKAVFKEGKWTLFSVCFLGIKFLLFLFFRYEIGGG